MEIVKYIVLGLSFIGWMVLGLFTLGILYLWIVPYMMVVMANFYYELKNKYSYSAPLKQEKEKIWSTELLYFFLCKFILGFVYNIILYNS